MDLSQFLSQFSPEQLAGLKTQLDTMTDVSGRSPIRDRQLHDLRILPRADDPRPTFFWSAEQPRNAADLTKTTPYPKLLWHGVNGQEITVTSAAAEATATASGYLTARPANAEAPDQATAIREALAVLSPEDRKTVLMAAQRERIAKVQEMAAGLSEQELDAILASLEPAKSKKSA